MSMNPFKKETSDPARVLRSAVYPFAENGDERRILDFIGDAPLVLLGEASHGTHEFYETRARITRRLIEEHGFSAVAIEGDWPDALRVGRFVQGLDGGSANDALSGFTRF